MSQAVNLNYAATGEPFSIGRVFSQTSSAFGQGFGKFLVLTGIAYIPMLMISIVTVTNPGANLYVAPIGVLVSLVVAPITTATCLFGALQILRKRDFTLGESFSVALSRYWPMLGASLLGALFMMLLMLLLLVPGLIYGCMIFVAQPACVVEPLGPMSALRRSRELTKGYRWPIFGLFILILIVMSVASLGAEFLVTQMAGPIIGKLAKYVVDTVVVAFVSVLYAVTYSQLRAAKEGVDVDQLARVFD